MKLSLFPLMLFLTLSNIALSQPGSNSDVQASPKPGWGEFAVVEAEDSAEWWEETLLWPVNRVLDFVDIFRVDVGLGGAFGGTVRITKYGQAGYRSIAPGSLRIGAFGRRPPVLLETSSEFGIGPAYVESSDRKVCQGELGVGVDLIAGAYAGICFEELFDFVGGIFLIDFREDDLRP